MICVLPSYVSLDYYVYYVLGSEAATGSVCATATFPLSHNPQATQAGWPPQTSLPASPKGEKMIATKHYSS